MASKIIRGRKTKRNFRNKRGPLRVYIKFHTYIFLAIDFTLKCSLTVITNGTNTGITKQQSTGLARWFSDNLSRTTKILSQVLRYSASLLDTNLNQRCFDTYISTYFTSKQFHFQLKMLLIQTFHETTPQYLCRMHFFTSLSRKAGTQP